MSYHIIIQDKLSVLVLKSFEELTTLVENRPNDVSKGQLFFDRMKEKVLRTCYNSLFTQPYNHAIIGTALCLEDPR